MTIDRSGSTKLKSPTGPFLPAVEVDRPRRPPHRDDIADRIERYLSGNTVREFVTPPPVRFAAGCGTLTFAQFVNFGRIEQIVAIFTEVIAPDGLRTAICMFGSLDNLADVIVAAPTADTGWSSSAAPEVFAFINSAGRDLGRDKSREEIAEDAVTLLLGQGGDEDKPAKRGFTYGHIGDTGEWLLEAYLDVEFATNEYGYDRIVIGAPLWIRTPTPQALVLYADAASKNEPVAPPFRRDEASFPATRKNQWWRWW
ncbi:hypothetical protein [Actinoplanes sp. RD1]|uniref:hypothetical protein n=1 Tax=Actinoplanes sp. RD1 TaxID=3064538 RepID=UPI00274200EB|nr:hypothetical protein [Actinoplanes sp. RD1]